MTREEIQALIDAAIAAGNAGLVHSLEALLARFDALEARLAESNGGIKPPPTGDNTPAPTEAEKILAEAKKLMADAQKQLQEAEQKTRLHESAMLLSSKLQASGLPASYQEIVAKQFRGKVFEEKDLDETIKEHREALAKLSESGQVVLPEGSRISVSPITPYDRFALTFLRLVARKPAMALWL